MAKLPIKTPMTPALAPEKELSVQWLVENLVDYAIVLLDPAGRILSWNEGAVQINGWKPEEVLGKHFSILFPPEDQQKQAPEHELQAAAEKGRFEDEAWRMRKDGSRFWANVVLTALRDQEGVLRGFGKVTRDMTEQQRTEKKLRVFLEAAPDAMVVVNQKGEMVLVNTQAERLFGYRREEMLGQKIEMLVPARYRSQHPAQRGSFFGSPRVRPMGSGLSLFALRKDGREIPVEISLSPIPAEEGVLVSSSIRDVTERRKAEELIRQQSQEILELSTPVMQIWQGVVAAPLIGSLDSQRAQQFTERLLNRIVETDSAVALVDIMGVPAIDTQTARHLIDTVSAVRLLGAQVILTGVRPAIAQTLVHLGVGLSDIITRPSLAAGLQVALGLLDPKSAKGLGGKAESSRDKAP